LNHGLRGHGARARAAFFVEKIYDLAQGIGVRGVAEIGALAADLDEADLSQLFEMVGERGSWNSEFLLDFAGDHAGGTGSEKEAKNLETGAPPRAEKRSAERVNSSGAIFAVLRLLQKYRKTSRSNVFSTNRILAAGVPKVWKRQCI
jgi:hypothetical protein